MPVKIDNRFSAGSQSFNMTPIIDIVFLLIIFFLVVCQFIEAENFPVNVPDNCSFAQSDKEPGGQVTTVTVMKTEENACAFAVGSEQIMSSGYEELVGKLVQAIDAQLKNLPRQNRVVTLRIDKEVPFSHAQYALAAVAASTATDIQLAVLRNKQNGLE